ncbi:hypothetical protein VaNZ11_008586 [Volvox africanus]|uniref:Secreted protein n=1 Tax=Volvox africanus TaxID=51714 RepID=A0ABQ5S5F5_9CHLO|nr:hypothetical protein VaNZ11_008586 [Volvox africanus]
MVMCFDRTVVIRFLIRLSAPWLSSQMRTQSCSMPKSHRSLRIHSASRVANAAVMFSAFTEDVATVGCNRLFQPIAVPFIRSLTCTSNQMVYDLPYNKNNAESDLEAWNPNCSRVPRNFLCPALLACRRPYNARFSLHFMPAPPAS